MKNVCIIGPVATKKKIGGVATFVESLADGFKLNNCNTIILTPNSDKTKTNGEVEIISFNTSNKLIYFIKLKKYLKKNHQDLIVGSTWYDFPLIFNKMNNVFKIHYLHGFGIPKDGFLKSKIISLNDRLHQRNFKIVSNSDFTKTINEIFYKIRVDKVIPIGISPMYYKKIDAIKKQKHEREYDVIYCGRIRYNKGVDKIIYSLEYIKKTYNRSLKMVVVGDGPQLEELKKIVDKIGVDVTFLGKINQEDTISYYCKSNIFVSLDPKEPYGQTYIEALMCGCKVISPTSGGQLEYLLNYQDYFKAVSAYSVPNIGDGIIKLLDINSNKKPDVDTIYKDNSYEKVASKILDYYLTEMDTKK